MSLPTVTVQQVSSPCNVSDNCAATDWPNLPLFGRISSLRLITNGLNLGMTIDRLLSFWMTEELRPSGLLSRESISAITCSEIAR
jgi:hypothetical protein